MYRWIWLSLALAAWAGLLACNKQKPPKLDYTEKVQAGMYTPVGLPGETAPGTPENDSKYMKTATGYPEEESGKKDDKPKDEPQKPEGDKDKE